MECSFSLATLSIFHLFHESNIFGNFGPMLPALTTAAVYDSTQNNNPKDNSRNNPPFPLNNKKVRFFRPTLVKPVHQCTSCPVACCPSSATNIDIIRASNYVWPNQCAIQ